MKVLRRLTHLGAFDGRHFTWALSLGAMAVLVYSSMQVALPLTAGAIVDDALLASNQVTLALLAVLLVALAFVSILSKSVCTIAFTWVEEKSRSCMQSRLLADLYSRSQGYLDGQRSGHLLSLLTEDVAQGSRSAAQLLSEALLGGAELVLILGVLTTQYGQIAFAALILIPIYMVFPLIFSKPARRGAQASLEAHAEVHNALQETIQGVREIRVLGREEWFFERLRQLLNTDVNRRLHLEVLRSAYSFQYAIYFLVAGLVYWFGGLRVLNGQLSVGELVALVALMAQLEGPVGSLTRLSHEYQRLAAVVERLETIGGPDTQPDNDNGIEVPPGSHAIAFESVELSYEGAERPAVRDISFRVAAGQRVAIVGPSGAGKSTLVSLLARLYEPQRGSVTLDERPLSSYALRSLRAQLGIVLQESMLFAGTVRENIRIGRLDASDKEVETSARAAHAHRFIEALPAGYDTEVGERGVKLSGGQRQRIGIARMLLRNPSILILDEATSALDAESERHVRSAIIHLMQNRTTLVVAHRPSSFADADKILVLDDGRIVAQGGHEALLKSSKIYRKLAQVPLRLTGGLSATTP